MRKINFFTHAILRTLPSRFCAPFLFTFHYYLRMLWCTYAHKTIWLYYSINFLPPQTYLLMLQTGLWSRSRSLESESVESHVFSWSRSRESESVFKTAGVGVGSRSRFFKTAGVGVGSRSRFFKTAGVGVRSRSRNICCNYRLQCFLNNLNSNNNCLKNYYWVLAILIVFWMPIRLENGKSWKVATLPEIYLFVMIFNFCLEYYELICNNAK